MARPIRKHLGLFVTLASVVAVFAGCKNKSSSNEPSNSDVTPEKDLTDEELIKAIDASNPEVEVEIVDESEYEHLSNYKDPSLIYDVAPELQSYSSSSILDMPKDEDVYVVFNTKYETTMSPTPSLFNNIVAANTELQTITVKDRSGKDIVRSNSAILTAAGTKLKVSGGSQYQYGEVYQISINDADFLCFENRDPSIRTLTIEIEDDPADPATFNTKDQKSGITQIDIDKVSHKKVNEAEGTYSFEYDGEFPELNKGDVFYVTDIDGEPNGKLDFYGKFERVEESDDATVIIYDSTDINDIYDDFHIKGQRDLDLEDAEVLITDELAVKQFKSSALALGIARTAAPLVDNDIEKITNILSKFSINFVISVKDNTLSMKFTAGINGYKLKEKLYLSINFSYEKITTYNVDFDVSISYSWIFPTGVNYKVKCIEDTTEIFALKGVLTVAFDPSTPQTDSDITDTICKEIENIQNGDAHVMDCFDKDSSLKPSTSGTKTTWPIIVIDLYYLAPVTMRFKVDFYIDTGFQAMLMLQHETHSTKADFCFSNVGGSDTDASNIVDKTTNWSVNFVGTLFFEVGIRVSYSFSVLGLYDYLKAEAYAEFYINSNDQGMLILGGTESQDESNFTGYLGLDSTVTAGMRVGLDLKILFVNTNINKLLWTTTLFKLKLGNTIEHTSSRAATSISMNKQTLSLNETDVLWYEVFNNITMALEEKKFKAEDEFHIVDGVLVSDLTINKFSGRTFQYSIENDPNGWVEVSKDGILHVKDGSDVSFDFTLKIHVSNFVGSAQDREIPVHFEADDAKEVYLVVGDNIAGTSEPVYYFLGEYRPGAKVTLPEGPKFRGYFFDCFMIYDGVLLDSPVESSRILPGQQVTVPEGEGRLVFQCFYSVARALSVYFYDANNNLVYVDDIYEGEDATEPYPEIRDRFTDTTKSKFMGWNRPIKNIKFEDTTRIDSKYVYEVYGIYMGIEGAK